MNTPNDRPTQNSDRTVRQDLPATGYDSPVNQTPNAAGAEPVGAYSEGYVTGQVTEQQRREAELNARDNDNAARGLLLGVLLAGLVGLTLGALYLLNQQNRAPEPVAPAPTVVPAEPAASPEPPQTQIQERVIRQTETIVVPSPVPVPQPAQPQAPAPAAPAPAAPAAPAPEAQIPAEPAPPAAPEAIAPEPVAPAPEAPPQ